MDENVVGMNGAAREDEREDEGDQPKEMNEDGIDEDDEDDEEEEIDDDDDDDDDMVEEDEEEDEGEEEPDGDDINWMNLRHFLFGGRVPPISAIFEIMAENLPAGVEYSMTTVNLETNESAVQLGRYLGGANARVTALNVIFSLDCTPDTARVFAEGISSSQIQTLTLASSFELPLEMAQLGGAQALNKLELSFPLSDDFVVKFSESLTGNEVLEHLVIQVDGEITTRGAKALAEFILGSSLTSLEFESDASNNLSTAQTIQTLYAETVQRCHNLQHFKVVGAVGDMFALAAPLPGVAALTIEKADLSLSEVEILCSGLKGTSRLTSLNLLECGLNDTHMGALSRVLGNHRSIKSLNFDKNQIGDAGVAAFTESWGQEFQLSHLHMGDNRIGAHGAFLLMKALRDHPTLGTITLNGNKAIGYDGIKMIGDCLVGTMLEQLDLNNTAEWIDFDDAMCEAAVLQRAKHMKAGKALLEGVQGNVQLRLLRFLSLRLSSEVKSEIQEYIVANKCGRRRLREQHHLPPAVWSHFLAKTQFSNTSMMFLFLRELPCLMMASGGGKSGEKRKRL